MALFENKEQQAKNAELQKKHQDEIRNHNETKTELTRVSGRLNLVEEELEAKSKLIEFLNEYKKLYEENLTRKYELDKKEKLLAAKENGVKNYADEIKALEIQVKEARESGYKEGYADGTADGVRKGLETTAEDRKMMAQIAAIAAASHVPEATSTIAKEVAAAMTKDLERGLPATTGTTDNKAE